MRGPEEALKLGPQCMTWIGGKRVVQRRSHCVCATSVVHTVPYESRHEIPEMHKQFVAAHVCVPARIKL